MKVLVVGSGKGGVGKSTVVVSLALLLKKLGWKIGIIDADIYGPSLKGMLEPEILPKEENGFLIPALAKGIQVVSAAYFSKFERGAPVRAPLVNGVIEQFAGGVKWDNRDLIIVDLPPGTGDIHLTLLQKMEVMGAICVTTPQKIAVLDVEKAIYLFQRMHVPILGVIENMSYYQDPISGERHNIFGEGGGESICQKFHLPFLGKVPLDPLLMETLDQGGGAKFSWSGEILWKIAIEISEKVCDYDNSKKMLEVTKVDKQTLEAVFLEERVKCRFSDLQERCPCARCVGKERPSDPDLSVTGIERVGRYAVRFQFTSGCSQGIYTWQEFSS